MLKVLKINFALEVVAGPYNIDIFIPNYRE